MVRMTSEYHSMTSRHADGYAALPGLYTLFPSLIGISRLNRSIFHLSSILSNLNTQVADFHCPHRTCQDAGLCFDTDTPADQDSTSTSTTKAAPSLSEGKELVAKVGESFTPGLEGYWEGQEDGAGASGCNPYAGAVLVVEEGAGKRKVGVYFLWCVPYVCATRVYCLSNTARSSAFSVVDLRMRNFVC